MEVTINKKSIGLKPEIDIKTKVLILGSFPGRESLEKKEYYANKYNQFWRIISDLFSTELECLGYDSKIKFLLKHGIGLWDIVKSCRRKGSSDNKILDIESNDIAKLLTKHSNIKVIFLNGRRAQRVLVKNQNINLKAIYLPSTSPAHAISYLDKKKAWAQILKFLTLL
jgi:hypoxanthine-DNA glycosylase